MALLEVYTNVHQLHPQTTHNEPDMCVEYTVKILWFLLLDGGQLCV